MNSDFLQSFLFDNTDIRGAVVKLDDSFAQMLINQSYSQGQQQLLAQFTAANLLAASHLKFNGLLSLQARGDNHVSLAMSECTHDLDFRSIIRGDGQGSPEQFDALFNSGALALTIEPENGQRYQGIVPIEGGSLANSLAGYFQQSEQIPSWFYFAQHGNSVAGLMLQALPAQICTDEEQRKEDWQRVIHLASTLSEQELCQLPVEDMLYRLYHEEPLRVFDKRAVRFRCSCSQERMERALTHMDKEELLEILDEDGLIEAQCHFCNRNYTFQRVEILQLLQSGGTH